MSKRTAAAAGLAPAAAGNAVKKKGKRRVSRVEDVDPGLEENTEPAKMKVATIVQPDTFEAPNHFYEKALNASLHPLVALFLRMGNKRIVQRYCHLHPKVDEAQLLHMLQKGATIFRWGGSDLFSVTDSNGKRQMVVVETNSCPSGQKSLPSVSDENETDGYHRLMRETFYPLVKGSEAMIPKDGVLAVIYDKNPMEASGYAAAMANVFKEQVHLVPFYREDDNPPVRFVGEERNSVMHIRTSKKVWKPVRAAFRYVTQAPWDRIPIVSRTVILNSVVACLAGGRNKMVADMAYEMMNRQLAASGSGLSVRRPSTIRDVSKAEVPMWVSSMGGRAVVKVPYSNAGQGVYTILNPSELTAFMAEEHKYDLFIVQSLVGNNEWSSATTRGVLYHTGTVPNRKGHIYVSDLRLMVISTDQGFVPVAAYARRAHTPLERLVTASSDSWAQLGTNLSIKKPDGSWTTDTSRLMLMDVKDFPKLGIGLDEVIDGYVQTCLSVCAIDEMALKLLGKKEDPSFNKELFLSVNSDDVLVAELAEINGLDVDKK